MSSGAIDADKRVLQKIFSEDFWFVIPEYQRPYVWQKDNIEELIEDLYYAFENKEDNDYFLGSLVLKSTNNPNFNEYEVLDGQQRLTTVTILAKAIFDSLPETNKKPDSGVRNGIQSFLFYRVNAADDFEDSLVKIEHSRIDNHDYSMVIKTGILNS